MLLGTSNLALGMRSIVRQARNVWGSPLDIMTAMGFGRSYGMRSRVFARSLPAILSCGLWEALEQRPAAPTAVLLTDVGNDLLYGAAPPQIADWTEQCLVRLSERASRLVVLGLPLESLRNTGRWRFVLLRSLLFPGCLLSLNEAVEQAQQLDELLRGVAHRCKADWLAPRAAWYGLDPIHIKRRQHDRVWRAVLARWHPPAALDPHSAAADDTRRLRRLRPEQRWLWGISQQKKQPAVKLDDGSLVSWF